MKEQYTAPELELLCLTAEERLANDVGEVISFDAMAAGTTTLGTPVEVSTADIDVPLWDLTI